MLQFCCAGVEYCLVAKRSKDQATSELEIALDHAILKNGTEIPLALGIQAIGRRQASAAAMADDLPATSSTGAMGSSGARASGGWDVRRCEVHSWIG